MKKLIQSISLLALTGILLVSCEEDKPIDEENIRDEYLGDWSANDTEGWNSPAFYDITITVGAEPDEIIIQGLYNQPGVMLQAFVNRYSVEIPAQSSAGISFAGSGKANVDFDQITLEYTANDGSGSDEVKTICARKP